MIQMFGSRRRSILRTSFFSSSSVQKISWLISTWSESPWEPWKSFWSFVCMVRKLTAAGKCLGELNSNELGSGSSGCTSQGHPLNHTMTLTYIRGPSGFSRVYPLEELSTPGGWCGDLLSVRVSNRSACTLSICSLETNCSLKRDCQVVDRARCDA